MTFTKKIIAGAVAAATVSMAAIAPVANAEVSAAVGVAAILSERFRALPNLRNVAVVLCGGNVDLDNLPWKK